MKEKSMFLRLILFCLFAVATQFLFTLSAWQSMPVFLVYIILFLFLEFSIRDKNVVNLKNDFNLELEKCGIESVHMDFEMWERCYVSVNKDFKSIAIYDYKKNFGVFQPDEIISCELGLYAMSQHRAGSALITIQLNGSTELYLYPSGQLRTSSVIAIIQPDGSIVTQLVLEFAEHSVPSQLCELVRKVMDNKTAEAAS